MSNTIVEIRPKKWEQQYAELSSNILETLKKYKRYSFIGLAEDQETSVGVIENVLERMQKEGVLLEVFQSKIVCLLVEGSESNRNRAPKLRFKDGAPV